jgi:prepilin-type N-terminal cleavage/methylation domain-containing protein
MEENQQTGESLIEVLIALLIFSIVATGLAQTLMVALRARRTSGYWMEATQLAVERVEQARSGDRGQDSETLGMFQRGLRLQPGLASLRLERIDVTVEWQDDGPKAFTLSLLQRPFP